MPWKEQNVMDARRAFINDYLEHTMSFQQLCERYEVSTKTGYKWRKRFYEGGYPALEDMSRRPQGHLRQLSEDEICNVIKLKKLFLDQGPKKIHSHYNKAHVKEISLSSVERILTKAGYTVKQKKRHITALTHSPQILEANASNDIWTVDFKGHWFCRGGVINANRSRLLINIAVIFFTARLLPKGTPSTSKPYLSSYLKKWDYQRSLKATTDLHLLTPCHRGE
ncbi:MAG: helix-turn-helix domain-containing protein [Candidatus Marinimicrobia bacterium]|nr:helix-turn-helix domain-containing protein [Candidatus Neomarinimicrobiota bacterium]MDD3967003.1 helix-turn-helix domain-containing protein [Candidatus Neomarinimicrobiota bacterium]